MAAAVSIDAFGGPTAVRVKNVPRERFRSAAAGAKSFESRSADVERRREEGRLDERERTELLMTWSGNGASPEAAPGTWYRLGVAEGLELDVRADHPAARSDALRRRLADAVARAARLVAEEPAP